MKLTMKKAETSEKKPYKQYHQKVYDDIIKKNIRRNS